MHAALKSETNYTIQD